VRVVIVLSLAAVCTFLTPFGRGAAAQSATQTHVAHIMSGFPEAPNGAALLPVAEADAALAVQHAQLAGRDRTDIGPMVQHARHILHILDPAAFANGPGSGFGLGPAARAVAQHVELAAQGAPQGVQTHSQHVAVAARAVEARTAEMIRVARGITPVLDYGSAYEMVLQLQRLAAELVPGADASGDGQISVAEGGLQHVRQHMELLATAAAAQ
jgi:hypothetical protein